MIRRRPAFTQALAALGWTDGRNARVDVRWGGADINRIRALAQELVGLQPDIILAISFPVTIALQQETRTIPIVFANLMDGDIITSWLQQYAAVWAPALLAGVAPAIIAFFKGRSVMGWYLTVSHALSWHGP